MKCLFERGNITNKNGDLRIKYNFVDSKIKKLYHIKKDHDNVIIIGCGNKKFEYWSSQEKLIPPWETNWFQLKDYELVLLKVGCLIELIKSCIKKAGNLNRLVKNIHMSYPSFLYILDTKYKNEMVSVKKLKKLANYANIPYDKFNNKILEIRKGKTASIKNPKFPINLATPEGAALLGAVLSDGCIYVDKKARMVKRTKYSSDQESIRIFSKNINKIFGNVHIQQEEIRNCIMCRIGSSIVGDALANIGAVVGKKYKIDAPLPWIIKNGSVEMKKAYLRAIFSDEGSMACYRSNYAPYITLSRYKHIRFSDKERKLLDNSLEHHMKIRKFPTGHVNKSITVKRALEIIKNKKNGNILTAKILNSIPNLLLDEAKILENLGIENNIWLRNLNKTHLGFYSICCDLFIKRKKSVIKFYREIGFSLPRKHKKLEKYINNSGWIKYGS